MELAENGPNVELRGEDPNRTVVLAFPYDARIVAAVRGIPHRRFDWDRREWWAPVDDWVGVHVADVLARFPDLEPSAEVEAWLAGLRSRWIGRVRTARHDGRGWFVLETRAGELPDELAKVAIPRDDRLALAPLTPEVAAALREQQSARLDAAAARCVTILELGRTPAPARLDHVVGVDGEALRLEVLWDPDVGGAFDTLKGAEARRVPLDPWLADALDAFLALHEVEVTPGAAPVLEALRAEHDEAMAAVRRSRATDAEPIAEVAAHLGGELQPFQWAAVRYALDARRTFLADEQGLGKTVEALAALEADGAYPAIVVCPASLKLNWAREAERWLPHRHAGAQPRRGADRPVARDRPARGLRVGRAVQPRVPHRPARLLRGAAALAPAPALLRPATEERGPAPAAGQAPGRRADRAGQRARVPARRGGRDRVAAQPATRPGRARRQDRRRAAGPAPRPARHAPAARRARQAPRRPRVDPRLS